jgi:hypothetical protein
MEKRCDLVERVRVIVCALFGICLGAQFLVDFEAILYIKSRLFEYAF